jgi:hypothetical protein
VVWCTKNNNFVATVSEEVRYALHSTLSHDIKKDLHKALTNDVQLVLANFLRRG